MRVARLAPGILLCVALSGLAIGLQMLEEHWTGRPYLEALVIAILLGTLVRTAWTPGERCVPGIGFSAKILLEMAVMLLGASISFQAVLQAGPALLVGIAAVVAVAMCASYGACRFLGLPKRMAILVACGNSICGNSAIAAVAPVIGARPRGHRVVHRVHGDSRRGGRARPAAARAGARAVATQYGVLAGLTVYAVPQVLAATLPVGLVSTQVGTLVKLVRVLMLGPVVLGLSLAVGRSSRTCRSAAWCRGSSSDSWSWRLLRSAGLIPDVILGAICPSPRRCYDHLHGGPGARAST